MTYSNSTIFALSTAMQRSAIGVIRVSGDKAVETVNKIFSRDISEAQKGLYHGFILDGENKVDEVMLAVMRGPKSFTGEDTVEISCHGGAVVISGMAAGIDGVFMEVHSDPDNAMSDGPNQVRLDDLERVLTNMQLVRSAYDQMS
mgnify:CR=1 FL=1